MKICPETTRYKPPARVGTLVDELLAGYGLSYKLGGWRVVVAWPEIVGPRLAAVSRAVRYADETLVVSVPDAVWRHRLSLETDIVLEKIREIPGGRAVKRIHFIS